MYKEFIHTNKYLDEFQRLGIPGCDISIYFQGKQVFRGVRGKSDEKGTPVKGGELYNLYSCSKMVTCIGALKLLEQDKISLNDDIADYLPAFKDMSVLRNGSLEKAEKPIKIFHLFTMTAGLNYSTGSEEIKQGMANTNGECPTVEMMNYIAKMPLCFQPGESWKYSLCHDVLGAVIEVVTKQQFGKYIEENIFKPLNMRDTTFLLPEDKLSTVSAQYWFRGNGVFENVGRKIINYKFGTRYESGGAGLVGTVDDYIKFLEGIRKERLVSKQTLDLMQIDRLSETQRNACFVSTGYGYGLGVRVPRIGYPRTDIGWGGAAGSFLAIDREREISVFYAQHVLNSPHMNLRKDIIEAVKLDLGFEAYTQDMWQGTASHLA